jgi:N-carbamoylputrescine amidase
VAFAEMAFDWFLPQHRRTAETRDPSETIPGPTTERFAELARKHGVVTVLNLLERDGERRFDTSPVLDADGRLLGATRMVHIMEGPGFHERDYYHPGDRGAIVYDTAAGKIGIAICYDRHFPEYMRTLALRGAEIVVVPQAGAEDEWPGGIYEGELKVASFQNGYFTALANRVGKEDVLTFAGESFVADPHGQVIARAPRGRDAVLYAEIDRARLADSPARRHFLPDRRPDVFPIP